MYSHTFYHRFKGKQKRAAPDSYILMSASLFIASQDKYLSERTGKYEFRAVRYRLAADELVRMGLNDSHTLLDLGAGWTEFDYCLRVEYGWRGRYIPVDGSINGEDLNIWHPPREYDFFVGLELLEHLASPAHLVEAVQRKTLVGGVVSVPDPSKFDIMSIDDTHITEVTSHMLEGWGFVTQNVQLYGGIHTAGEDDALLGVWEK